MLTRSFMTPESEQKLLAYTPMFHSRMFTDNPKYRDNSFQPTKSSIPSPTDPYHQSQLQQSDVYLDGNPSIDRPLFVQFCSNDPDVLLEAAKFVQPYCDAVDLNLGCPQGIARRGKYGAFLQEDWDLVYKLINGLHTGLNIPVTAKMRILDTMEKTLEYAKTIISAGASIITVHGRQRHQKGHNTGLADWAALKYLREHLPPDTVIFANGNILQHEDIDACLKATGADGVMSAEGNLNNPAIFAAPPTVGQEGREYWRGRDGKGGYRMDAVMRRYMDIIYKYVLSKPSPDRKPLFLPTDRAEQLDPAAEFTETKEDKEEMDEPPRKKQKRGKNQDSLARSPNLTAMQAHLFNILRPLVKVHTNVRDALARCRTGDIPGFENVLRLVEAAVKEGLIEYELSKPEETAVAESEAGEGHTPGATAELTAPQNDLESSLAAVERCKRPWWICQPYVRPLPQEALAKGAMTLSKKEKERLAQDEATKKAVGLEPEGKIETTKNGASKDQQVELPKEGVVCG
jgi:tRNA-dihydrouridine synthase 1